MKLAIRKVVGLTQKAPAIFEMKVRLQDGSPAIVEVSTLALANLRQRTAEIFQTDPD